MQRIIVVYGAAAGLAVILSVILGVMLSGGQEMPDAQQWLSYLVMLVALSLIFAGIKRYRNQHLGGNIRFRTAMLVGIGIAAVSGIVYVAAVVVEGKWLISGGQPAGVFEEALRGITKAILPNEHY